MSLTTVAPYTWRCTNCNRVLGTIAGGYVTIQQVVRGRKREIVAPLPTQQRCVCGYRQSMPPAERSAVVPA